MDFRVSVIIPVYNAEKFIEKAILSALQQTEVDEVIVVNDGSKDNTLKIVETIQKTNPNIKLFHHNNKVNKGRSASRNLGIKNSSSNFIAFLDADDFYLKNRFTSDKKMFQENKEIDGVYNAIGVHFYRKYSKEEQDRLELTTVTRQVAPDILFEVLLKGKLGHFSIDGLTVKKSVFHSIGYFSESLVVSEDTELIFKLALKCHLEAGIIDKPLAIRGVHESNVFNSESEYKKYGIKMYESLLFWSTKNQIQFKKIDEILNIIWFKKFNEKRSLVKNIGYWRYLFFKSPRLLFSKLSVKYFPIIRLRKKLLPFLCRQ
jgi:glycosyltransferase involved in cell wall biosynthesis